MSTYLNCYELVASVRRSLGEYSEAKVRGEDTFGAFYNDDIVTKINEAIQELYALISKRAPGLFLGETTLTGVNSVYTLPWDFARLEYFKDDNGLKVFEINEAQRRLTDSQGSDRFYRRVGNTLVLDKAGVTKTYTLIYHKKPRKIYHGLAAAGGSQSITLDRRAPKIADYFNGMGIEIINQDVTDTITDYTAARVATITGTGVANDPYGIVPELPVWSHELIAPRASLKIRAENPLVKRPSTQIEYQDYNEMLRRIMVEHLAAPGDQDIDELFTTRVPALPSGIGIIETA